MPRKFLLNLSRWLKHCKYDLLLSAEPHTGDKLACHSHGQSPTFSLNERAIQNKRCCRIPALLLTLLSHPIPWNFNLTWRWNNTDTLCLQIIKSNFTKIDQSSPTTVMKMSSQLFLLLYNQWVKIHLITEIFFGKIPQLHCFCSPLITEQSKHSSSPPFSSDYKVKAGKFYRPRFSEEKIVSSPRNAEVSSCW